MVSAMEAMKKLGAGKDGTEVANPKLKVSKSSN